MSAAPSGAGVALRLGSATYSSTAADVALRIGSATYSSTAADVAFTGREQQWLREG